MEHAFPRQDSLFRKLTPEFAKALRSIRELRMTFQELAQDFRELGLTIP
jgi:hypothetical protein